MLNSLKFKYKVLGAIFAASALVGAIALSQYLPTFSTADAFSKASNATRIEKKFDQELQVRIARQKLPIAGSYVLQKISNAPDGELLDSNGEAVRLRKYTVNKYTVLTFFYDMCSDAKGCPYALTTMHLIKHNLEKTPALSEQVRFVNISFDPERDTPLKMAGLEKRVNRNKKSSGVEWRYFTAEKVNTLIPLIDAYGQNVDIAVDQNTGKRTLEYPHVLKLFLIDQKGVIREIYSTAFLSPEMVLNDIQTLMIETEKSL